MTKAKKTLGYFLLAAAFASAVYAVSVYNKDLQFYPHADSVICVSVFAAGAVIMTAMKKSLIPLLICTAAGTAASVFCLPFSFLIFPALLTVCLFVNITAENPQGRFCRNTSFVLDGITFIPFIISIIKDAGLYAGSATSRDSVFDYFIRALAFALSAFCFYIFIKSFSVIKTKPPVREKKKSREEKPVYPESIHTVYLLAALNSLASAVYCCVLDDNALICAALIARSGCLASLLVCGDPVLKNLTEKAADFFGIPADFEKKGKTI